MTQPLKCCKSLLLSLTAVGLLVGCEAALNLEGVHAEQAREIRRTDDLQGIASNGTTLVAVGNQGLVLRKDLNATQWQRQQLPGQPALIGVAACADHHFVALDMDKQVWRSDAAGANWQAVSVPTTEDLITITCAPDNSIWLAGSFTTLLHSTDAGSSWQENTLNEDAMITRIQFLDAKTAVIGGEFGLFSRSEDGGKSWSMPNYLPGDFYVNDLLFTSSATGWVSGLSGKILKTVDGGEQWQPVATPTTAPLYGLQTVGERLVAFGDRATILLLQDQQWQRVPNPHPPVYLRAAVAAADDTILVAGGAGSLYAVPLMTEQEK